MLYHENTFKNAQSISPYAEGQGNAFTYIFTMFRGQVEKVGQAHPTRADEKYRSRSLYPYLFRFTSVEPKDGTMIQRYFLNISCSGHEAMLSECTLGIRRVFDLYPKMMQLVCSGKYV